MQRRSTFLLLSALAFAATLARPCPAADGWRALFNGKDLTGWQTAAGKPSTWAVKDGVMVREAKAGDIWTRERFGDFVLDLEFKTEGNSGVFIRTDKPTDNVQTGLEFQVYGPAKDRKPSKHSCGAFYDAQEPTKDVVKEGEWNRMVITAQGPNLTVEMNGEKILQADLDQWTTAGKNPDGSKNKYKTALKDFKREGHIGLQDHGANVCYRNVKIKVLKGAK